MKAILLLFSALSLSYFSLAQNDDTATVMIESMQSGSQQLPGTEPQPGEELEDEPPGSTASVFLSSDFASTDSEFEDSQFCVRCPPFIRRCRCRFSSDCRYIRRTCFSCDRWRCRRRGFGFGFGGFDRFGRFGGRFGDFDRFGRGRGRGRFGRRSTE